MELPFDKQGSTRAAYCICTSLHSVQNKEWFAQTKLQYLSLGNGSPTKVTADYVYFEQSMVSPIRYSVSGKQHFHQALRISKSDEEIQGPGQKWEELSSRGRFRAVQNKRTAENAESNKRRLLLIGCEMR